MLDPDSVDLRELCAALDDHTPGTTWLIDVRSGHIRPRCDDDDADDRLDPAAGWVEIRPTESRESYRDMAKFVAAVQHRRAADLLDRAITGRGAFRRFKDTLFEFPELRDQWFRFRDVRSRRRALSWLAAAGLVSHEDAERASARFPDPTEEEEDLPAAVAVDLGILYGDRLTQVLVCGAWARGSDPAEADLELLVVLADLRAPWDELRRMDETLWRHTFESGTTVLALPVSRDDLVAPLSPALVRAITGAVVIT